MDGCGSCALGPRAGVAVETTVEVAGYTFEASLRGDECSRCGHVTVVPEERERFDLLVASKLAEAGDTSGEAFRFMRCAIGLTPERLAQLLDVSPESILRWERNDYVYRSAAEILGALVVERLHGAPASIEEHPASVDLALSLRFPRPLAKAVRLVIDPAQAAG